MVAMGDSGYNSPNSRTWHVQQRCSGTVFSFMEQMDSNTAENRGLSPCSNCCGGEWPHDTDGDESSDRDPVEWLKKIDPGETALEFSAPGWRGPEYVGMTEDGTYLRWPLGWGKNVAEAAREQVVSDLEDPGIEVQTVPWEGTPLTEWEGSDDG